jgi:hypothetical protein
MVDHAARRAILLEGVDDVFRARARLRYLIDGAQAGRNGRLMDSQLTFATDYLGLASGERNGASGGADAVVGHAGRPSLCHG